MAASFRSSGVAAAPPLLLLLLLLALAALAAPPPRAAGVLPAKAALRAPISLVAQSSEIDYRSNQLVFRKVKITQGTMSVSADLAHATGLDFDNSHWVFHGHVHVVLGNGELRSSDADITFADKLLARATVHGTPAQFSQLDPKSGRLVLGRAKRIDYDVRKGVVEFAQDAWLSDGRSQIRGESLKYDIAARRVIAKAADQGKSRVHITITPPAPHKP